MANVRGNYCFHYDTSLFLFGQSRVTASLVLFRQSRMTASLPSGSEPLDTWVVSLEQIKE